MPSVGSSSSSSYWIQYRTSLEVSCVLGWIDMHPGICLMYGLYCRVILGIRR